MAATIKKGALIVVTYLSLLVLTSVEHSPVDLARVALERPVRLLGVRASQLEHSAQRQRAHIEHSNSVEDQAKTLGTSLTETSSTEGNSGADTTRDLFS